jgi:hypothetical protein
LSKEEKFCGVKKHSKKNEKVDIKLNKIFRRFAPGGGGQGFVFTM